MMNPLLLQGTISALIHRQVGFSLWLEVGDDVVFVRQLMAEQGVLALPAELWARPVLGQSGRWLCAFGACS